MVSLPPETQHINLSQSVWGYSPTKTWTINHHSLSIVLHKMCLNLVALTFMTVKWKRYFNHKARTAEFCLIYTFYLTISIWTILNENLWRRKLSMLFLLQYSPWKASRGTILLWAYSSINFPEIWTRDL